MITTALCISLIVYFIKVTTWKGMIFEWVHKKLERLLPEKIYKPFIGCPICMTPWWGSLIYFIGYNFALPGFLIGNLAYIIFVLFIASGISSIILMFNKIYDTAKKEEKVLEDELNKKNIDLT